MTYLTAHGDGKGGCTAAGSSPVLRIAAAFLALFAAAVLAGCANVDGLMEFDEPEIELLALEPMAGQGMEARFRVRLRIVNPNSIPLEIEGMAYDVFLRDSKVLSGVSNQPLSVDAYSEGIAELEVAAGMFASLALLRDLMNDTSGELPYRLNAKLSRKGFGNTIRVSREGEVSLGTRL